MGPPTLRCDRATNAVIAGLVLCAITLGISVVFANDVGRFIAGPADLTFTSFRSSTKDMQLELMILSGDAVPIAGSTVRLLIDGELTVRPLAEAGGIGADGQHWRAGERLCLVGLEPGCLAPLGEQVQITIATSEQLVYEATHFLRGFKILPTGGILTGCAGPVELLVVGSEITYGKGGPPIPVMMQYTRNGGKSLDPLFEGQPVKAGNSYVDSMVAPGSVIGIRGHAKYSSFSHAYLSYDSDPHVHVLRDGHAVPDVKAFDNQTDVAEYLGPYVDGNEIRLALNEAIILYEFNPSLNSEAADFQDLVVLVRFPRAGC